MGVGAVGGGLFSNISKTGARLAARGRGFAALLLTPATDRGRLGPSRSGHLLGWGMSKS